MKRKFNCSSISMLTAALTLSGNFESKKQVFVAESAVWDDPFVENFRTTVQRMLTEVYGINTQNPLTDSSANVNRLVELTRTDLELIRTQMMRGFREDPEMLAHLLDVLGFKALWRKASKTQSAVISILFTFRNNLSGELRTAMEQNGVSLNRLNAVLTNAVLLNQANVVQESMKGTTRQDTEKVVIELNNIYARAMDICYLGKQLFKGDKLKKELFTFSRLVAMQGGSKGANKNTEEAEMAAPVAQIS